MDFIIDFIDILNCTDNREQNWEKSGDKDDYNCRYMNACNTLYGDGNRVSLVWARVQAVCQSTTTTTKERIVRIVFFNIIFCPHNLDTDLLVNEIIVGRWIIVDSVFFYFFT